MRISVKQRGRGLVSRRNHHKPRLCRRRPNSAHQQLYISCASCFIEVVISRGPQTPAIESSILDWWSLFVDLGGWNSAKEVLEWSLVNWVGVHIKLFSFYRIEITLCFLVLNVSTTGMKTAAARLLHAVCGRNDASFNCIEK